MTLKFAATKMQPMLNNHEDIDRVGTGLWVKVRREQTC